MKKQSFVRTFVSAVIAAAVLMSAPWAAVAQDVPPYLVHQGRLMDALNAPVNGAQDLTFSLYVEEVGGTSFWTETQTVLVTEGFYSVTLGQGQSLDLGSFNGETLYLGVTVAGEELSPRLALRSVPYAIKSGTSQSALTAENVTGDITPTSITVGGTVIDAAGITVNGATIVDPSGQWAGPEPVVDYNNLLNPPTTFDSLNCLNGDVAQFVGGAWTCTPASSADTLSGLGCAEGQTAKFIAGAWTCADDTDTDTNTTYTAGNGITIGASNDIAADTAVLQNRVFGTCSAGFSIRQVNADGSVVCEDDSDTTYLAGAGVTITGTNNTIAVDTAAIQGRVSGVCGVGESIRQINADGAVICEPDTDTTYSADPAGGLTLSGTNAFGIAANAITSARIADGTIAGADLATNAIGSAHIADGAVASADIADGTIANADLAANSVGSSNIINATIGSADINSAEVQRRVSGACAVGESIRQINADGTVVCEAPTPITTFDCVPGAWDYYANTIICSTTITLAKPSLVMATVTGHWFANGGWCIGEILFPGETQYGGGNSPYEKKDGIHMYVTTWTDVSYSRHTILPAGTHTVSYGIFESSDCRMNGSSMTGFVIPVQ